MRAFFVGTNSNRKINEDIKEIIGDAYDVWELLNMPPVRSGNLIIHEILLYDIAFNENHQELWHCNIEFYKKGILISIRGNSEIYSWCVPFYQLSIFQSTHLTIHSNGFFIRLKNAYSIKQEFFQELISKKNDFLYPK
ncbi:hypothetical protein N8Z47_01290 [Salibacteraceae bacterium]|nr:hypothetical protein [Salibacteraceae bacterium]